MGLEEFNWILELSFLQACNKLTSLQVVLSNNISSYFCGEKLYILWILLSIVVYL